MEPNMNLNHDKRGWTFFEKFSFIDRKTIEKKYDLCLLSRTSRYITWALLSPTLWW